MSSGGKATFTAKSGPAGTFAVQYNPREFQTSKSVTWQEAETQGQGSNPIQYQKGAPMTVSMELIFDTTNQSSPASVQTTWVDRLLAFTNATEAAVDGEQKNLGKKRPPVINFTWGSFALECVIESVNVTYLMFASNGDPVRAKCQVKLKEYTVKEFTGSGGSAGWTVGDYQLLTGSRVVVASGGQTLSQLAAANGTDAQTLAAANGIIDLLEDITGKAIAIPSSSPF
jgi:hypothetical protein